MGMQDELIIALEEEIGDPNLFVGRKKELTYFQNWCANVKNKRSQSTAILARRKKGKTALVQRLFNILYTNNDPKLVPFYFKIKEGAIPMLQFADLFYRSLMSQYFGCKLRDLGTVGQILPFSRLKRLAENDPYLRDDIEIMAEYVTAANPDLAWDHARDAGHRISHQKDERIIQIIDEFQFLNQYIYRDEDCSIRAELASFYQSTAESKVSPQLITGSYIGILTTTIRKMISRYQEYFLESFPEEEAIDAVYNYSTLYSRPVTDETALLIARICDCDPYYISRIFQSHYEPKNLTQPDNVLETLQYETTLPGGQIAKVWLEYIWDAFNRVNDIHAKTVVLYLAKYGDEERTIDQIIEDLQLGLTRDELQEKLYKLERADMITMGSSPNIYKGLGDKIFEIVFRRLFEAEIKKSDYKKIETDIRQQMTSLKGKVSHYKGIFSEYRVINLLTFALYRGANLGAIVRQPIPEIDFGPFDSLEKTTFHFDQENRVEVDIFCRSAEPDGVDFVVEVKDWQQEITVRTVQEFIDKKKRLEGYFRKKIGFIFYSENGISPEAEQKLWAHGIMTSSGTILKAAATGSSI